MVDGKLLHRIVVWPTYEDAAAAEEAAASADCKRSNKLTVWQTQEQAAENTHLDDEGEGGGGEPPEEDDDMALISSGAISSPVTFFDIVLPAGYAKFKLDLIDFLFSGSNSQPQLAYIMSPDGGDNWYQNIDDFDSYSFSGLSEDVSTAIPAEGLSCVGVLAANGASKDIYFNGELTIWPGSVATKAMVRSELNFNSGDPFTWNSMASRLETAGRQNRIRFSFGDASFVPPNGNNEWTAGNYTLYGYA